MPKLIFCLLQLLLMSISFGQKLETVYLDVKDTTSNMYIALVPQKTPIHSYLFLLDGFGSAPRSVLVETGLPTYAAQQGILVILPILKSGPLYFGSDSTSQASLKEMIEKVEAQYHLKGKPFYIGGFSIGGTCAVKYAELAIQKNYPVPPKAVFAVDPPLDWERFYNAARRVVRLSEKGKVNSEVSYMIDRIEKEMGGNPQTAIENYYEQSPYSYTDTTQRAIKALIKTPVMIITEPDIQWWLQQRGYDYSYINCMDQAAMINELQKAGNDKAVLVTTTNKGFRPPNHNRHPHSWSIADPEQVVRWLRSAH